MRHADVVNVAEHPRLDAELDSAGDSGGDDLAPEHGSRRDLHVVAELEVGRERQRLRHRDVAPRLEHHHCDRSSGKRITDDQLCDHVQADLLVGDRLDYTDGNGVDECDDLRANTLV